jgi:hypothetical protein
VKECTLSSTFRQQPPTRSPARDASSHGETLSTAKGQLSDPLSVALQMPLLASMYLSALIHMEPTICDALCSHLATATNPQEIRFQVAICIAAFRMALTLWLEQEATGDRSALLRENPERHSFLSAADAG